MGLILPKSDRPRILFFPPGIAALTFAAGWFLQWSLRWKRLSREWTQPLANLWLGIGVLLLAWALLTFRRGATPANPYLPTRTVMQSGPYRFTRNPMYVANMAIYAGTALYLQWLGPLVLLPVLFLLLHFGVVRKEEAYLAARFGDAYLSYLKRTRRWL